MYRRPLSVSRIIEFSDSLLREKCGVYYLMDIPRKDHIRRIFADFIQCIYLHFRKVLNLIQDSKIILPLAGFQSNYSTCQIVVIIQFVFDKPIIIQHTKLMDYCSLCLVIYAVF